MYKRILVPLENSPHDDAILQHIRELVRGSDATLLLLHVADGFTARNYRQLNLRESEEMQQDRAYLERICAALLAEGYDAEPLLGAGDPAREIAATAEREHCDLIAMATHGHRGIQDVLYGSTASEVRHLTRIPVLMVRSNL